METNVAKGLEKVNKATMESVKRLGEINARALERLAQHQLNVASAYLEGNMKQFQAMTEAKGVQDIMGVQSRMMSELKENLVSHAKQTVDLLMETKDEYVDWVEEGKKALGEAAPETAAPKKQAAS